MAESRNSRRLFLSLFSGLGLGTTLLPGVLWAQLESDGGGGAESLSEETIEHAERIAGVRLTPEKRRLVLDGLRRNRTRFDAMRAVDLPNHAATALEFRPLLPARPPVSGTAADPAPAAPGGTDQDAPPPRPRPDDIEELAFWPVTQLAPLLRSRQVSSRELTELYLRRLERYDPKLRCVITLTAELARRQAARADAELAAGRYRGPLHGIPWGAKDLLAADGHPTTWGAAPYRDQVLAGNATVVRRLEEAGAVLVAKLTLGALAMGDYWFGGRTRTPWNPERGSSGSSAGSAAATAAGLVAFAIGSETNGSIVSPCTRCGVTGLRPTFGRVSRHGAMTLSWSMDKLGPIARSAADCALVLEAIAGPDGQDTTVVDLPFLWDAQRDLGSVRVGYARALFDAPARDSGRRDREHAVLDQLRALDCELAAVTLPDNLPIDALYLILEAEAAAAFDELTRSQRDDLLVRQGRGAWPNTFRTARFIPAVEYIQANRIRRLAMTAMEEALAEVDVYVAPSFGGDNLLLTNLTGHPCVVVPTGRNQDGLPTSISFIGRPFADAEVLTVARAYQEATEFHLARPEGFAG